jgi:hypothetical protein
MKFGTKLRGFGILEHLLSLTSRSLIFLSGCDVRYFVSSSHLHEKGLNPRAVYDGHLKIKREWSRCFFFLPENVFIRMPDVNPPTICPPGLITAEILQVAASSPTSFLHVYS